VLAAETKKAGRASAANLLTPRPSPRGSGLVCSRWISVTIQFVTTYIAERNCMAVKKKNEVEDEQL